MADGPRIPFVAANWKMHFTRGPAEHLACDVVQATAEIGRVDIAICPPATALAAVGGVLTRTPLLLGAQTMHEAPWGPFTGEISAPMLVDLGCRCVILGSSERRRWFGETDAAVGRKVRQAILHRLIPIICVGERLADREARKTDQVVMWQVDAAVRDVGEHSSAPLVVAYEPVWSIGTARIPTADEVNRVALLIRSVIASRCGAAAGHAVRVLYGGSVEYDNPREFFRQPDIDGALVGNASLNARAFTAIARAAAECRSKAPPHA